MRECHHEPADTSEPLALNSWYGTLTVYLHTGADTSDPLALNWSKPLSNPFAVNTGRDPSAAWQTPAGEWQFTTYAPFEAHCSNSLPRFRC